MVYSVCLFKLSYILIMEYKIENVEVLKLFRNDKDRNGMKYVSKKGLPFEKVDIHIDPRAIDDPQFQGKFTYFDYFGNTTNWGVGMPISGIIKKNGEYFNFEMLPSGKKALELDFKELETRVRKLEEKVFGLDGHSKDVQEALDFVKEAYSEPKEDKINEDDLPF